MRLHEKQAFSEKGTCLARQQDEAELKSLIAEHPDVLCWTMTPTPMWKMAKGIPCTR